jgi:hypothetical protein
VLAPSMPAASASLSSAAMILHTATGESRRTYVDSDGSFAFYDVPAGVHMLHPFHMTLIYPEVRGRGSDSWHRS